MYGGVYLRGMCRAKVFGLGNCAGIVVQWVGEESSFVCLSTWLVGWLIAWHRIVWRRKITASVLIKILRYDIPLFTSSASFPPFWS